MCCQGACWWQLIHLRVSFFLQLDLISIVLLKMGLEGLICHYTSGKAPSLGFFGKMEKEEEEKIFMYLFIYL